MTSAFGDQQVPMMTSANNVGEGWHPILRDLEEKLNEISPDFTLQQVKEKFGGLRYYAQGGVSNHWTSEEFQNAILEAEEESFHICELCGEPGKTRSHRGWLKTLCEKHDAEREAAIKKELSELHVNHGGEA